MEGASATTGGRTTEGLWGKSGARNQAGRWALAVQNLWPLLRSNRAWPSEYRQPPDDGRDMGKGRCASLHCSPGPVVRAAFPSGAPPKLLE